MNPESPKFESKTIKTFSIPDGAKMLVFEQTFYNEEPTVEVKNMPETDIPVAPPVNVTEEPMKPADPTESQLFWRKMLQTENSPYDLKKKEKIKFDSIKGAIHEMFTDPKSYWDKRKEWVKAIDKDLRGGRELDPLDIRMKRVATLGATAVLFSAFDMATGKVLIDPLFTSAFGKGWEKNEDSANGAWISWARKFVEVLNDKYASDIANWGAEKLTGKRVTYVHELPDKANDMITTGFRDELSDKVNGSVLESLMRISYEVPIAGAISEQILTNITGFQERSSFHKDTGKAIFMATGVLIDKLRKANKAKMAAAVKS